MNMQIFQSARRRLSPWSLCLAISLAACGGGNGGGNNGTSTGPDVELLAASPGKPANPVKVGDLALEPPTLRSLAVEWSIEGDANHNAVATVQYRESGQTAWKEGLPLVRLQNEQVLPEMGLPPELAGFDYTAPNMFTGSVFDLEPGKTYEIQVTVTDPDGVQGPAVQTITGTTRPVPQPPANGNVYHVYPDGWTGPRIQPAFDGLLRAYNTWSENADWNHVYNPRVQPGDTILVHVGVYVSDRLQYGSYLSNGIGGVGTAAGYGVPFDGMYLLYGKGTAEKPITIKAAGDGEVWFDGAGNHELFNVMATEYHIFDGINIRNTDIAFRAGLKRIAGAKGLTIRNSRIEDVGSAVITDYEGSRDFYIADNTIIGRQTAAVLRSWNGNNGPDLLSFRAIELYGPGHVVEFNHVERFHDGITLATYGDPDTFPERTYPGDLAALGLDPRYARGPSSVDFMNNDIYNIQDICIEPDGGGRNIRVLRNRCFNDASQGIRSQPSFAGPHYVIRNVIYNARSAEGPTNDGSGMIYYNNTVIAGGGLSGRGANTHARNNLFIAFNATGSFYSLSTFTSYSSSDYNGFSYATTSATPFSYTGPKAGVLASYVPAELVTATFPTLAAYQTGTGQDLHSKILGLDVFMSATLPSTTIGPLYAVDSVDLQLKPGSAAIDAGVRLPNITDNATGAAPDLGAYELGTAPPHYGPRP
jgi:hypothetical protein